MASAGGVRELSRLICVDGIPLFVDPNKNVFSLFKEDIDRVGLGNTSGVYMFCWLLCCHCLLSGRFVFGGMFALAFATHVPLLGIF